LARDGARLLRGHSGTLAQAREASEPRDLSYQGAALPVDDHSVLTERFKERFDWFGLVVSVATLAFGVWDRLHGRSAQGNYLILLGLVVGIPATVSLVRRVRA
jgi:hypothetical protein